MTMESKIFFRKRFGYVFVVAMLVMLIYLISRLTDQEKNYWLIAIYFILVIGNAFLSYAYFNNKNCLIISNSFVQSKNLFSKPFKIDLDDIVSIEMGKIRKMKVIILHTKDNRYFLNNRYRISLEEIKQLISVKMR